MDVGSQRGGLLVHSKSSLLSKILTKIKLTNNTKIKPFELNLRKGKWLFVGIYKPPW